MPGIGRCQRASRLGSIAKEAFLVRLWQLEEELLGAALLQKVRPFSWRVCECGDGLLTYFGFLSQEGFLEPVRMVYLEWDEFMEQATQLFMRSPNTTRYTIKFRGENKVCVLKVTDNQTCLKHKVKVARDVKHIDTFNSTFLRLASSKTV